MKTIINGVPVEGTVVELANLIGLLNAKPIKIDYNSEGIESSIPTPAGPAKQEKKTIKTKYEIISTKVDGKTVYRIKSGAYTSFKGGGYARKAINSEIKALKGILTGKFQYTLKDGTEKECTGWYFKTKKAAEAALKTLPTSVEW